MGYEKPLHADDINAFGDAIKALMLDGDSAVLVAVGSACPSENCRVPSALATVRGCIGSAEQHDFTGNAVSLQDAILIARGKLRDARERHERARQKAKDTA